MRFYVTYKLTIGLNPSRRHKTLRFCYAKHSKQQELQVYTHFSSHSSPKGAVPSIPGRCCIDNGLVSRLRNSTLGKPESLKLGCKQIFLTPALQGNFIFNILDSKQTCLLCSEGRSLSHPRLLVLQRSLKLQSRTKCISASVHQTPVQNYLPTDLIKMCFLV